jgi:hypothetical protein
VPTDQSNHRGDKAQREGILHSIGDDVVDIQPTYLLRHAKAEVKAESPAHIDQDIGQRAAYRVRTWPKGLGKSRSEGHLFFGKRPAWDQLHKPKGKETTTKMVTTAIKFV